MAIDLNDPDLAQRLRDVFDQGRLLALPTETVYGLAAPIDRLDLIARVFQLKGRPPKHPLIVHVGTLEQARRVVSEWPMVAEILSRAFWPGPLSLVLPRSALVADAITGGRDTVAVRMPDHPVALAVLRALDVPLVAPSANLFTKLSPTCTADVQAVFSAAEVELIEGGDCQVGIESTIVGIDSHLQLVSWLRPGMIDRAEIARRLPAGWRLEVPEADDPVGQAAMAPGRMKAHYRPNRPLIVHLYRDREAWAGLHAGIQASSGRRLLELPADADQAAHALYRLLREADLAEVQSIDLLLPIERLQDPAWEGVINRLRKAATQWLPPGDAQRDLSP